MRDDDAVVVLENGEKHSGMKRRNTVVAAVLVLIMLLAGWGWMYTRVHRSWTVEAFLKGIEASLSIAHPLELVDRAGGGQPFTGFVVQSDSEDAGAVYTVTVPNAVAETFLSRLAGSAPLVTLAVYIDRSNFIRRVQCLDPLYPAPFSPELDAYLAKWKDLPANNVMWDNPALEFGLGGGFGPSIRARLRDLTGSAFIARYGVDRYMSELILKGARGLKVGEPLPEFTATSLDGSTISTALARGHKLVITASQPTCGPCFDATVLTMAQARGPDVQRAVVVFGSRENDRTRALIDALDQEVDVIIDPEKTVGHQLYVVTSPWVVLVDRQGIVRLTISGYETEAIEKAVTEWLAAP
jgi:peroxiredoxin